LAYDDRKEQDEAKENIKLSDVVLEEAEKKTIEDFLSLVEDLEQQEDLMTESSNKTIRSCGFEVDKLCVIAGIAEDNPSYGTILSGAKSYLASHDEKDVKHKDTVLEEADKEILLLENLLRESESSCELESQVNKLCFNSFDEEMKFLEECIGKDAIVKDSVSLDSQMGVFPSNAKDQMELLQQKEFTKSLFNEGNISNGSETIMSHMTELVIEEDREKLAFLSSQKKDVGQTSRVVTSMEDQNSILMKSEEVVSQRNWICDKEEESNEDEGEIGMPHAKEKSVLEWKKDELVTKISQGDEGQQWHVVKKEDEEQQLDIAEGDAYKSIKEVWVAVVSRATFETSSKIKIEIKSRKAEEKLKKAKENNQQFRDE